NMRRASKGYSGVVTPLFDTMLVQPQDESPSTSLSRITASPSLSSHRITSRGHTPGSDKGRLKHDELMELVTKLLNMVVAIEEDLKQTKRTYSTALTQLVLKVKKLEKQVRFGKARRRARIVLSEDEDEDVETQEKNSADTKVLVEEETSTELNEDLGSEVSTATHDVSTAAAALVYIRRSASKAKDKVKAIIQELEPIMKLKKRVQV
ncbi:hypothetical protein Tco_0808484, partial [Tanacetum coccineum]